MRVADWAWKYIAPLLKGQHPDAKLFDGIPDRWAPQDPHNDAVKALVAKGHTVFEGYTMRDQRHTYAVRAIRAGTPAELVARQLGHANAVLVHSVYGRFSPSQSERDKWERIAAAQDRSGVPRRHQRNGNSRSLKGAGNEGRFAERCHHERHQADETSGPFGPDGSICR